MRRSRSVGLLPIDPEIKRSFQFLRDLIRNELEQTAEQVANQNNNKELLEIMLEQLLMATTTILLARL